MPKAEVPRKSLKRTLYVDCYSGPQLSHHCMDDMYCMFIVRVYVLIEVHMYISMLVLDDLYDMFLFLV